MSKFSERMKSAVVMSIILNLKKSMDMVVGHVDFLIEVPQ